MSFFNDKQKNYAKRKNLEPINLVDWFNKAKEDTSCYSSAYERMLKAIGEPEKVDTSTDPRLGRIHGNKIINRYPAFSNFYGMEDTIEQIVSFFTHAAQDLEEAKQILYLLGPVGSAKSSLAEELKRLMQKETIHVLGVMEDGEFVASPVQDHPFCLIDEEDYEALNAEYGFPVRVMKHHLRSAWVSEKLKEFGGDITKFHVKEAYPSILDDFAIAKTEPGDENNQDISALVGNVDIRELEDYPKNHPYAYGYDGALCKANQGIMEFVEMFKAPIKVLHPLLTATQERNYNGTTRMSALPFEGIVLAHSNESEWQSFRNNKNNEAFLDRVYVVKVPYALGIEENVKIFDKLLSGSKLNEAPCAPGTLRPLAEFAVLSRISEPENSSIYAKMMAYNGQKASDRYKNAKSLQEYRENADPHEGMEGISPRWCFKILSQVFNYSDEISANPVHLFDVLEKQIKREQWPQDVEDSYFEYLHDYLIPNYVKFIGKQIQEAFVESYDSYGQNIFDRYILLADVWTQKQEGYRNAETGEILDREAINAELEKIEKPAGISNPKDFRGEVVNTVLRLRANNQGKNPNWKTVSNLRKVIEAKVFTNFDEMLPVISFSAKATEEEKQKHDDFVNRMLENGYTKAQVRILCDWYIRITQSN